VALGAGDLFMEPRQRVSRVVVRKSPEVLPIILIVAARAVRPKVSAMLVIMATCTKRR
jgi:hypothetical protein